MDVPGQKRPSVSCSIDMCHLSGESSALLMVASLVPTISKPNASVVPAFGLLHTASRDTKSFLPSRNASSGQYQRSSVPVSKTDRVLGVHTFSHKYRMVKGPP